MPDLTYTDFTAKNCLAQLDFVNLKEQPWLVPLSDWTVKVSLESPLTRLRKEETINTKWFRKRLPRRTVGTTASQSSCLPHYKQDVLQLSSTFFL